MLYQKVYMCQFVLALFLPHTTPFVILWLLCRTMPLIDSFPYVADFAAVMESEAVKPSGVIQRATQYCGYISQGGTVETSRVPFVTLLIISKVQLTNS